MGKLFGTDGIRGVVNAGLDADLVVMWKELPSLKKTASE